VINIAPLWSHSCTFIREEDWDLSKKKRGSGTKLWDNIPFNSNSSSTCPHPTHKSFLSTQTTCPNYCIHFVILSSFGTNKGKKKKC